MQPWPELAFLFGSYLYPLEFVFLAVKSEREGGQGRERGTEREKGGGVGKQKRERESSFNSVISVLHGLIVSASNIKLK